MTFARKLKTFWALGPLNVARVARYRLMLANPRSAIRRLSGSVPAGPFFTAPAVVSAPAPVSTDWRKNALYFGFHEFALPGNTPDWFFNPFTQATFQAPTRPWWTIPDFDPRAGDIKILWEASRMDWAVAMAQRAVAGEAGEFDRLEHWLADWNDKNPPYCGPNWKCGQETSIRVVHLAMVGLILGEATKVGSGLSALIATHLQRVEPTTSYAKAQNNNHGTSEAAALFIGGSWLEALGDSRGRRWSRIGRTMMEERVAALVEVDGSFSQYSTNYHRLMLDTLAITEVWRRRLDLPAFSDRLYARAKSAVLWLHTMVDPSTGDAANIGANDGARLLPLGATPYRDFRPSVQLAAILFEQAQAYEQAGPWNQAVHWLRVPIPASVLPRPVSRLFDDGGYAVLVRGDARVIMRYPRFRYRPSHADALHVDLWAKGVNIFRDGGTFSYSASDSVLETFSGTLGHSTVQFDGRDQMPRQGRFLFADWLRADSVSLAADTMEAAYTDSQGARHKRRVTLADGSIAVVDTLSGLFQRACLRWRLAPADWVLTDAGVKSSLGTLIVRADMPIRLSLIEGVESHHYLSTTPLPVLVIDLDGAGEIQTQMSWQR